MKEYLLNEMARLRAELDAMDERRPILLAEMAVFHKIIAQWEREQKTPAPRLDGTGDQGDAQASTPIPRRLKISPRWRCVMVEGVRRAPRPVSHDDVPAIQQMANQEAASRQQIRSHVWTFAGGGFYEKQASGSFVATEKAAIALGMRLGEGGPPQQEELRTETPSSVEMFSAPRANGSGGPEPSAR